MKRANSTQKVKVKKSLQTSELNGSDKQIRVDMFHTLNRNVFAERSPRDKKIEVTKCKQAPGQVAFSPKFCESIYSN